MTFLDWAIVLILNGAVILYGFYLSTKTESSNEWFLGGRSLPWWGLGLSIFATSLDNADVISLTGKVYNNGIHIITVFTLASVLGACLSGFLVVPVIYRASCYTNAEFLEARFGKSLRVLSAFIQIQYRSCILGMMIWSIYLMLRQLIGLDEVQSWGLIILLVVLTTAYTVWGGLTSVVWTDALQSIIVIAGTMAIFFTLWNAIGGWDELTSKLESMPDLVWTENKGWVDPEQLSETDQNEIDDSIAAQPLTKWIHMGEFHDPRNPHSPFIILAGWIIIGCGYTTVNHTQTMRLLGARSLWDMKMAAVLGSALGIPIMVSIALLGVIGRVLFPDLTASGENADQLFPLMAQQYLQPGLKGLVVAAIVSATISTFDSMGSALSALFTRDIYARWIVQDKSDSHYILVSRIATVAVMMLGFLFVPFIASKNNMVNASLSLIPVFVTPLFTIYLLGALTRVHKKSGLIGFLIGSLYGVLAFTQRETGLFDWMGPISSLWIAYPVSFIITSATMILVTLIKGKAPAEIFNDMQQGSEQVSESNNWLNNSRGALPKLKEHPFQKTPPRYLEPAWIAFGLILISCWVVFGLFW